jgi:hypothetical protein
MKRIFSVLALGVLLGLSVQAQEGPKAELFFGYSFVRYNSAQTIPAFTANGGIGTFAWNFSDHLGVEAQLGGVHNGNVNNLRFDTTAFQYLFGPRLSRGRHKTIDPYIHILFGGQNASTSIAAGSILVVNPLANASRLRNGRYETSTNNFAMSTGGGLDIKVSNMFTVRPIQLDYYLTRLEAIDVTQPVGTTNPRARNQNNLQYAAGVSFNFGAQ